MGFFSLSAWLAEPPDWSDVIWWNLIPAGIGNIIGGGLGVAVLLGWAYARYDSPSGESL
jgi:formate transporter